MRLANIRALNTAGLLAELRVIGSGASISPNPSADVELLLTVLPGGENRRLPGPGALEELANVLSSSDLFLSYYQSALLWKSSSLTAAMACGCPPVLPELNNAQPLVSGRDILECDGGGSSIDALIALIRDERLPEIGENARAQYEAYASWPITTRAVTNFLQGSCPSVSAHRRFDQS